MTAPNSELAYQVLDHIDAHPDQLEMTVWIVRGECGTVGCFAGWACLLSGDRPAFAPDDQETNLVTVDTNDGGPQPYDLSVPTRAIHLLRIDDEQATRLFYAHPDRLRDRVGEIFGPRPAVTS